MSNWFFIAVGAVAVFYVVHIVRRNKLSIKESFWWLVGAVTMLLLAVFPQVLNWAASALGVYYPPTLLLMACVIFLLFIIFKDGRRIANLQVQNIELEQQIALIKNQLEQKSEQKESKNVKRKK